MSVDTIKQIMRDYREIVNPRNKTVGSVLKHYRVDKGLTLEEVSESSCSVSYLSKVENNKLVPSDKILDKLLKRLGLTTKVFEYEKKDTKYIDEILELGYVPNKLINNAKNKNDYQSKIIKFAYTLLNQEKSKLQLVLKTIYWNTIHFLTTMNLRLYILNNVNYMF